MNPQYNSDGNILFDIVLYCCNLFNIIVKYYCKIILLNILQYCKIFTIFNIIFSNNVIHCQILFDIVYTSTQYRVILSIVVEVLLS